MKKLLSIIFFACLGLYLSAQVSVAVVPNNLSYVGLGPHELPGLPMEGATYVLTGNIYRGDLFEDRCPDNKDCGILVVLTQDTVYTLPEFPDEEIIGEWNTRAFVTKNLSDALEQGGAITYSTQSFTFNENFTECQNCLIVTEGKDYFGGEENEYFKKAIVGGTTETYRLIKGESEQIYYKQPENENETGGFNFVVNFLFDNK